MMIGLSSPDKSLIDMSLLSRWTIVPRLLSVPGVANVSIWDSGTASCRCRWTRRG